MKQTIGSLWRHEQAQVVSQSEFTSDRRFSSPWDSLGYRQHISFVVKLINVILIILIVFMYFLILPLYIIRAEFISSVNHK